MFYTTLYFREKKEAHGIDFNEQKWKWKEKKMNTYSKRLSSFDCCCCFFSVDSEKSSILTVL